MIALKKEIIVLAEPTVLREEVIGSGHLKYSIIKTNTVIENQPICVYGVRISSTLFSEGETAELKDVSTSFEIVNELFEMLVQNMVLPCTLSDITYDFLVSKY